MSVQVQIINDNCLPTEFKNFICKNNSLHNKLCIRSNLKNMADINKWVSLFGIQTNTQWNVRSSRPEGTKIVCSKKFVCHHSGFMKIPRKENKRGLSKNANCRASILIVIKLDTINTRQKDAFIKKGLQAVITIENEHNHTLETAETVRFLQAKSEIKDLFFEYFNNRLTISEAKKFHEQLYEFDKNKELLLATGSKNPTYRTVQNWYHEWSTTEDRYNIAKLIRGDDSPDISSHAPFVTDSFTEDCASSASTSYKESNIDMKSSLDNKHMTQFKTLENDSETSIVEICNIIKTLHTSFGSSSSGLKILKSRLNKIKSEGQWETFLHTAGNCTTETKMEIQQ